MHYDDPYSADDDLPRDRAGLRLAMKWGDHRTRRKAREELTRQVSDEPKPKPEPEAKP
jgi:hypothetical protein